MSNIEIFRSIVNASITNLEIPSSVKNIRQRAFSECSSLTEITIPSSVTNIENNAFDRCSSLTEVTIPSSVTNIGSYAFNGCSSLTEVNLSTGVTNIGSSAFYGCALTEVTIPSSVSNIGSSAFSSSLGTQKITTIRFEQPSGMVVTLPTAGSSTGMLYNKNAIAITVYTDNETIKNYDYATDNMTATILHLDGSAWE